jgi:hypothetical protein
VLQAESVAIVQSRAACGQQGDTRDVEKVGGDLAGCSLSGCENKAALTVIE